MRICVPIDAMSTAVLALPTVKVCASDTVTGSHSLEDYLVLLAKRGTLTLVGVPKHPNSQPNPDNLLDGRTVDFSMIGGIAETQGMLDFCAVHGIVADIKMIAADGIEAERICGFARRCIRRIRERCPQPTTSKLAREPPLLLVIIAPSPRTGPGAHRYTECGL